MGRDVMRYLLRKIFFIAALMTMSTVTVAQEVPSTFSHIVLKQPFSFASEEPWSRIIRTQEEWEISLELLAESENHIVIPALLPQVDFETFQLIAGGIGFRPSGGYSVSVSDVIELDDVIHIRVFVVSPGKNCIVTAQATYPLTLILIRKSDKPIQFSSSQLTDECSL